MTPPPSHVIHYLRSALGPDADGPADAALVARFARDRDEAAFELLVWRHAGMVLRVCRAALRDHHAAEDACQAVFLALARQAGSVGRRGSVAGWLYRVALRVSRRAASRRPTVPAADLDHVPAPGPDTDPTPDPAVARILQDELERLPEKYRVPVLLCFFEGLTHADAARRLGWPVGTVATRVARAKDRLHRVLTRRGVAVPAAVVGAVLAADAAAVPPSFAGATARAAVAFAAREGVVPGVSATVLELAKGAIPTMTKFQSAAGVLALCGLLTVGGVWATSQGPGAGPGDPPPGGQGTAPARPLTGAEKAAAGESAPRTANSSQRQRSLKNLQKILLGFHNFHDTHTYLPADIRDKAGKPLLSWRVAILPYIDQGNLYKQFKLDEAWDSEHNLKLLTRMPQVYRVGIEPKDATHTYYQVFAGPGTPFGPSRFGPPGGQGIEGASGGASAPGIGGGPPGLGAGGAGGIAPPGVGGGPPGGQGGLIGPGRADTGVGAGTNPATDTPSRVRIHHIVDGTSNTLGVVEAGPPVAWTKPADLPFDPKAPPKPTGPFANVLHVAFMDGSTTALRPNLDPRVLRVLIGMDDGEVIPDVRTIHAVLPPETAEERAILATQIARNQELLGEVEQLMRERAGLLGGMIRKAGDLGQAEGQAEELKLMAEQLRAQNKKLRAELGLKDGDPVPGRGKK